jgi:hypothetical protein
VSEPERLNARGSPSESKRCKFKFDVVAVLKAVTALAEHATAGTITPDIKRAWTREHAALFPFPPAHEVADHIERCAAFKKTIAELIVFVLGKERAKAGMSQESAK